MALTAVEQIDEAYRLLEKRLHEGATVTDLTLLVPAHPEQRRAYWHPREHVWAVLHIDEHTGDRYWCTYGVQDPATNPRQRQPLQINVRRTGALRNVGGMFARDSGGHIYYLDRANRKGGDEFKQRYSGPRATVDWGDGHRDDLFVVGQLNHPDFVSQLATYVRAVLDVPQPPQLEQYYSNAIMLGVDEAIQHLQTQVASAGNGTKVQAGTQNSADSVARIRLDRLEQLQEWLVDDPELMKTPVDRLTGGELRNRRRRLALSIVGAVATLIAGWLLSAVSPTAVLQLFLH